MDDLVVERSSEAIDELIVMRSLEERLDMVSENFSHSFTWRGYDHKEEIMQITRYALNLARPGWEVTIRLSYSGVTPTPRRNKMTFSINDNIPFFMIVSEGEFYRKYIPEEVAKTIAVEGWDPEGWREIGNLQHYGGFRGTYIDLLCECIQYAFNYYTRGLTEIII